MEIRTFGVGERLRVCEEILCEKTGTFGGRLFLLPIPTTRDKIHITGTDIPLGDFARGVGRYDAVAGYGIPDEIKKELLLSGAALYDGGEDEEFLLRNARITARGALGYLLTEERRDITDIPIGIIGYGRIGRCLLQYLLYLGADVTVYTTRAHIARELCESGVNASSELDGLSGLEILINTAPAKVMEEHTARQFAERGKLVDLASGNVFSGVEKLVKLPSVPEKMYPESAGRAYADAIMSFLGREGYLC